MTQDHDEIHRCLFYFGNPVEVLLRLGFETCFQSDVALEIYEYTCFGTDILQAVFLRALNSAVEIGLSPKQFKENIATLLKAIEFHRDVRDPSTMLSLAKTYLKVHTPTLTMNISPV